MNWRRPLYSVQHRRLSERRKYFQRQPAKSSRKKALLKYLRRLLRQIIFALKVWTFCDALWVERRNNFERMFGLLEDDSFGLQKRLLEVDFFVSKTGLFPLLKSATKITFLEVKKSSFRSPVCRGGIFPHLQV